MAHPEDKEVDFHVFVTEVEPRLRRAFRAAYGVERGREATAEALAYAWENWSRVREMKNPSGYLYRVGHSRTRLRRTRPTFDPPVDTEVWVEPGLPEAVAALSENQRIAVFLVHGYDTPVREVASLLGVREATVHTHLRRGLSRLRRSLSATPGLPHDIHHELEDQKGPENA